MNANHATMKASLTEMQSDMKNMRNSQYFSYNVSNGLHIHFFNCLIWG